MNDGRGTVSLPLLEEVALTSFSLYTVEPNVTVPINRGIFCLAGANGLGKSSFIAALNYAFTGGVSPASPKLQQLSTYYRDAVAYSQNYFTGRIAEMDREDACVALTFTVKNRRYRIRRPFFAPHELRELSIEAEDGSIALPHVPGQDAEERHKVYVEQLLADTGLETFQQFVFLQHFVFSFDEHRHLLFWDPRATELVLYLAFGLDPQVAKQVDELRKSVAGAGSLARNAQYQATVSQKEADRLKRLLRSDAGVDVAIFDEFRTLQRSREDTNKERNRLRTELADARLEFAEASAQQMRKRQEYEDAFTRRIIGGKAPGHSLHSVITESLSDHLCRVCGTPHDAGPDSVVAALERQVCPLCDAPLQPLADNPPDSSELIHLDAELAELGQRTVSLNETIGRLDSQLRNKQEELGVLITRVEKLRQEHDLEGEATTTEEQKSIRERIAIAEGAADLALARKEEQIRLRNEALEAYTPIQAQLKRAWNDAEVAFVPRFRALAEEFIGLPLQVTMEAASGIAGHAHLALSVNSTHRRRSEQLSESQRFFLDIALRMSLAQHMTNGASPATLYIDTPEGALDIAYEAKAGDMFASFSSGSDRIVMTANVNTSQLLKRMAARCRRAGMQFVRMTEWTTLTDVQNEEEELFSQAFDDIEDALDGELAQPARKA